MYLGAQATGFDKKNHRIFADSAFMNKYKYTFLFPSRGGCSLTLPYSANC
jgi:hypothetical protein